MMITHIAVVRAVQGCSDQLGQCLHALQEPAQNMVGCLGFEVIRQPEDPALWWVKGNWQSDADMQAYFAAPLLQQVLDEALRQRLLVSLECLTHGHATAL